MENKRFVCVNCFSGISGDGICKSCGWDAGKAQLPDALPYFTKLGDHYILGRVKSMNAEGLTYSALDIKTRTLVEVREFFPVSIAERNQEGFIVPIKGYEKDFYGYSNEFVKLAKGISRMRDFAMVSTVLELFEANQTVYVVYEFIPSITIHKYIERRKAPLTWNEAQRLLFPAITAFGLMNSIGISHLGISPNTLRITQKGNILITGFSINAARRVGTSLEQELMAGFSPIEQYEENSKCGEPSDVYSFAATVLYALTGQKLTSAIRRVEDHRLMISRDVVKNVPSHVISALANALQVRAETRTASFERLKAEMSAPSKLVTGVEQTNAIRKLPSMKQNIPQNRGVPSFVWLIASFMTTMVALGIVSSVWLKNSGKSFEDIKNLFPSEESVVAEMVTVPKIINENYDECKARSDAGEYEFVLRIYSREFSNTVSEGNIISQTPFAGEAIERGGIVTVTVSRGSEKRILPEIQGMIFSDLAELLAENGFAPVREDTPSDEVEIGYAIGYKGVDEGDSLPYGATVTVLVSSGVED